MLRLMKSWLRVVCVCSSLFCALCARIEDSMMHINNLEPRQHSMFDDKHERRKFSLADVNRPQKNLRPLKASLGHEKASVNSSGASRASSHISRSARPCSQQVQRTEIVQQAEIPCHTRREVLQERASPCNVSPCNRELVLEEVQAHETPSGDYREVVRSVAPPFLEQISQDVVGPTQERVIIAETTPQVREFRDVLQVEAPTPCQEHQEVIIDQLNPCQDQRYVVRQGQPCHVTPCQEHRDVVTPCQERREIVTPYQERHEVVTPCQERLEVVTPCQERREIVTHCQPCQERREIVTRCQPCQERREIVIPCKPCQERREIVKETITERATPCQERRYVVQEAAPPCHENHEIFSGVVASHHQDRDYLNENAVVRTVSPGYQQYEAFRENEALSPLQDRREVVRERSMANPEHYEGVPETGASYPEYREVTRERIAPLRAYVDSTPFVNANQHRVGTTSGKDEVGRKDYDSSSEEAWLYHG